MIADGEFQHLRVARRGGVATVTLDRPDVHNAFNAALIAELTRCFAALGAEPGVRAIVLTGAGQSFSAGADLTWMRQSLDLSAEENVADAERLAAMFETIDRCPRPVVARVNGAAFGGGVGLVAVCDIAVAAEGARFAFSETKLGIAPAVIAPFVVRKIGLSHARALFLTGARFDVARTREIGLVHDVVPADRLDAAVDEQLALLLSSGPEAVGAVKDLLAELPSLDPAAARRATTELIARLRTGAEGQEGIHAFLEKRKAAWVEELESGPN
jgi:methylglutaconyl-CoA hydratase